MSFQPTSMSLLMCTSPLKEYQKACMPPKHKSHLHRQKWHMHILRLLARNGNVKMHFPHSSALQNYLLALAAVSMRNVNSLTEGGTRQRPDRQGMKALYVPSNNHSRLHFWIFGLSLTADVRITKFKIPLGKAK